MSSLLRGQPCLSTVTIDVEDNGSPIIYFGSFGLGWNLFGHSGLHSARDGAVCSSGQIYRLASKRATRPSASPRSAREQSKARIAALSRIVDNDPKDALNRVKLGNVLLENAQYRSAQDMFQAAVDADPGEKAAYLNLALVLDYRGRTNEAEAPLIDVLERYPDYADAHSQLSIILVKQGRPKRALQHIERALKIDDQQVGYHLNRGAILAGLGRLSDAKTAYEEGLRLDPGNQLGLDAISRIVGELK